MSNQAENTYVEYQDSCGIANLHKFTHQAMATVFEIFIVHDEPKYACQAANEAFKLIDSLELKLSKYVENSEISELNGLGARQPLVLSMETFECLEISIEMSRLTKGAFDVTSGAVVDYYKSNKKKPSKKDVSNIGSKNIVLDADTFRAALLKSPVNIDLGGIGKGYAVDKVAELFEQWGISSALIVAGFSSIYAINALPGKDGWPLTFSNPTNRRQVLLKLYLNNRAVSASGLEKGQHIIDPRNGKPVSKRIAAYSFARTAAEADALSTAFMIMAAGDIKKLCSENPDYSGITISSLKKVSKFGGAFIRKLKIKEQKSK
jgi:thiamine biosynthesis lipoprotein